MADLITSARAKYNLDNQTTTSAEDTTIAALITAVSKAIEKYCQREFSETTHDEVYSGSNDDKLILKHSPIIEIEGVWFGPKHVLTVKNTSSDNQRAFVRVTSTGVTVVRIASGVETASSELTYAGNATLADMKTAIELEGSGWSAEVISGFAEYPSTELQGFIGSYGAKTGAKLRIHSDVLEDYTADFDTGILRRGFHTRFDENSETGVWFRAPNYWRVRYSAGFATIPEDIQEAAASWTAALFWQTKRDPGLIQEWIPGAVNRTPFREIPPHIKQMLEPYRARRINF